MVSKSVPLLRLVVLLEALLGLLGRGVKALSQMGMKHMTRLLKSDSTVLMAKLSVHRASSEFITRFVCALWVLGALGLVGVLWAVDVPALSSPTSFSSFLLSLSGNVTIPISPSCLVSSELTGENLPHSNSINYYNIGPQTTDTPRPTCICSPWVVCPAQL